MATKKEDKKELRHSEWEEQIADCQSNGMKIYAYSQKKNRAKMVLALYNITTLNPTYPPNIINPITIITKRDDFFNKQV